MVPESDGAEAEAETETFVNGEIEETEEKDPEGLGTGEEEENVNEEEEKDDFPKWQAQTKGENKTNKKLKDIKSIEELANKYLELKGKTDIPKSVDEYKVDNEFLDQLPLMDGMIDKLKENALKKGVPAAAFKYSIDTYKDILTIQAAEMKEQMAKEKESASAKYQKEWGDDFSKNLILMNKGIEAFGGNDFRTMLNTKGLGNDPKVIDFLVEKGKTVASKKALEGDQSEQKKNPGYITYKSMENM